MADAEPTRDDLLAWCGATKPARGYKAAAKHFGLTQQRVREIVGEPLTTALDPAKAATRTPLPRGPHDLDDDELPADLDDAEGDIDIADVERNTLEAVRQRARWLADPRSIGTRSEQGTAVAFGVLVDKLEKLQALARGRDGHLDGDGPDGGSDAAGRVRSALGLDPGREDEG